MKSIEKVVIPVIVILIITVLGCYYISKEYKKQQAAKRAEEIEAFMEENAEDDEIVSKDDLSYELTSILVGKNPEEGTLTFMATENNKVFSVKYDGATRFLGKHGNSLSLAQLSLGEILDINYSIHSGKLNEAAISQNAWSLTDVTKFEIDKDGQKMIIAGDTYKLPKKTIVSYGEELAEMIDITDVDTLTVKGVDRRVCSIIVDRGHGYVRLLNDSYFVGGWIEIGQEIIKPVSDDMLIPVPEGEYHVRFTNRGYAGEDDIEVLRDKETTMDLSEIEIKEVAIGHVEFNIVPDYAQLFIDDEMTEYTERVPLEYGIHKIHVELAGYESVNTNIKISDEFADVGITLEKSSSSSSSSKSTSEKSSSSDSSSSTNYSGSSSTSYPAATSSSSSIVSTTASTKSSSSSAAVISDTRKMYVEAPVGAEVYVDGVYIGICPVAANKPTTGTHVITLSKNGYQTKSYTITAGDEQKDLTLSFSELMPY